MSGRSMQLRYWAHMAVSTLFVACGAVPGPPPIDSSDSNSVQETDSGPLSSVGASSDDTALSTVSESQSATSSGGDPSDSGAASETDTQIATASATDDTIGQTDNPTEDTAQSDSQSSGTGSDSSSDTGNLCEPHYGTVCSLDGREVLWIDSCWIQTGVAQTCPSGGACVAMGSQEPPAAHCECDPGLAEPNCEESYCNSLMNDAESCEAAAVFGRDVLPMEWTDNMASALNHIDVACDAKAQPGRDRAYRVYLFPEERLDVQLETESKNAELSLSLFAVNGEPTAASCSEDTLAACSDVLGSTESLSYKAGFEGWYLIVVDSSRTDQSGQVQYYLGLSIDHPRDGECYDGGGSLCNGVRTAELSWSEATISPPMQRANSGAVGDYLFTTEAGLGTATETVTIPCSGYYYVQAWGWTPFALHADPPSTFYLRIGTREEALFELGSTFAQWKTVVFPGIGSPEAIWLEASDYTVVVRGGESNGDKLGEHPALGPLTFTTEKP